MGVGVFVLGMHRSGTSAAARLVNLLGVPTCLDDLLPTSADNPTGHWESASLKAFNDRLLAALECDWTCPVELAPGWETDAALAGLRAEGVEHFARVFPTVEWVWKDPRNCVTFAFWASCLDARPVVLLVHRNPLEVAASLRARDRFASPYALALWERYLRSCLAAVAGLPALVTDYHALVSDPRDWCDRAQAFLDEVGVTTSPAAEDEVVAFVDAGLRHDTRSAVDLYGEPSVSEAQRRLFDELERLCGAHERLPDVELPPESPTTAMLLDVQRRAYREGLAFRAQYEELEAYSRDLGERFLALETYARELQQQYAALDEHARELQSRVGGG